MGNQLKYVLFLFFLTIILHIISFILEAEFSQLLSILKVALPLAYWGAVTGLVVDITSSKELGSENRVIDRMIRTVLVMVSGILGHATLFRFKGFGSGGQATDIADWTSSIYFSVVTWTTLGYGDFSPTESFYLVAASEALLGYVTMSLLIGIIFLHGKR